MINFENTKSLIKVHYRINIFLISGAKHLALHSVWLRTKLYIVLRAAVAAIDFFAVS